MSEYTKYICVGSNSSSHMLSNSLVQILIYGIVLIFKESLFFWGAYFFATLFIDMVFKDKKKPYSLQENNQNKIWTQKYNKRIRLTHAN